MCLIKVALRFSTIVCICDMYAKRFRYNPHYYFWWIVFNTDTLFVICVYVPVTSVSAEKLKSPEKLKIIFTENFVHQRVTFFTISFVQFSARSNELL